MSFVYGRECVEAQKYSLTVFRVQLLDSECLAGKGRTESWKVRGWTRRLVDRSPFAAGEWTGCGFGSAPAKRWNVIHWNVLHWIVVHWIVFHWIVIHQNASP